MNQEEQKSAGNPKSEPNWEKDLVNRLAFASLKEQRRSRRWSIFFKFLLFIYLFVLLFTAIGPDFGEKATVGKHTAQVEVNGPISDDSEANAEDIIDGLRDAFEHANTKGVILRINSPGGSPVQSDYIYNEIRRLRSAHEEIPVYAVIVDMGASGAYYIASAADAIYANPASIVGSIGVLMNSFGFVKSMDKLGVERRLYTAGENKAFLDPFSPVEEESTRHIQAMLKDIHQQFIGAVQAGRGDRLSESEELFSGLAWTGQKAEELGLIDGMGDVDYVARELIEAEEVVDFTRKPDLFKRFADRIGASMAGVITRNIGLQGPELR
ncbi:signal peptide peptidase SppA [Thiohalomonas denitrificans]|uniref:Protease-4 n=1 Tax=Thiohalomonas denitrificans TaxID=415747 RepID=A0A1G5QBA6_9GAMM|nr:signal peptide peptidase SppA [Thiohalomonas denitrificans]SCZ58908.1 protease-4 [Thiohalomonas denitrificans]